MKSTLAISIPKPCSENWNTFTPTLTGGFCGSCNKNVIDFTKASDDEIVAFILKKPEHACGRFRNDQLKVYTVLPDVRLRPGFTLVKAGVISLLLLLISKPSSAQLPTTPSTEAVQSTTKTSDHTKINTIHAIRGKVIDAGDSTALYGVTVVQKGTMNGTTTDKDGTYELTLDISAPRILIFSFIGMSTQEVKLSDTQSPKLDIAMFADVTGLLGEVIWTGEPQNTNPYTEKVARKKFWSKIKSWF